MLRASLKCFMLLPDVLKRIDLIKYCVCSSISSFIALGAECVSVKRFRIWKNGDFNDTNFSVIHAHSHSFEVGPAMPCPHPWDSSWPPTLKQTDNERGNCGVFSHVCFCTRKSAAAPLANLFGRTASLSSRTGSGHNWYAGTWNSEQLSRGTSPTSQPTQQRPTNDRKPPSKKKRSDANQLEEDKAWYLAGAVHPEFGRLRSAAVSYWNRFCLFVVFVDTTFAVFGSAWDYLSAEHVEAYFSHLGCGVPKKGGRLEPASSGWLDTVKRTFDSMADCFVCPHMDDQQWAVYSDRTLQAKVLALKAAQTMARQKVRGDILVPDHHRQFDRNCKPGVSMNSFGLLELFVSMNSLSLWTALCFPLPFLSSRFVFLLVFFVFGGTWYLLLYEPRTGRMADSPWRGPSQRWKRLWAVSSSMRRRFKIKSTLSRRTRPQKLLWKREGCSAYASFASILEREWG